MKINNNSGNNNKLRSEFSSPDMCFFFILFIILSWPHAGFVIGTPKNRMLDCFRVKRMKRKVTDATETRLQDGTEE